MYLAMMGLVQIFTQEWKRIKYRSNTLLPVPRNYADNIPNWNGHHADEYRFTKEIKEAMEI